MHSNASRSAQTPAHAHEPALTAHSVTTVRSARFAPEDHTFVVCAYGESPYLEECLTSLEAQEQPTRIMVVTSTPNDLIADAALAYDVPLVVNQGEAGIAGDWNFALSCVNTPLATIAHQDDVYLPSYARAALEWMNVAAEQSPGTAPLIYFCDYAELRNGCMVQDAPMLAVKRKLLTPLRDPRAWSSVKARRRALSLGNAICCPSVTYNLQAVGRPVFSAGMRSNLDWEAWERLSKVAGSFVYDDAVRMCHRVHEGSETSACIQDDVRTQEDLALLSRFWPLPVARAINAAYSTAQRYN